jgi:dihydrolipoamide dehydrogenase
MSDNAKDTVFDAIVIGAGPGGYVAAIRGAQLGLKVACVEKRSTLGGTCLNVGCIPSKALLQSSEHFAAARDHFDEHGIEAGSLSFSLDKMMERKSGIVDGLTKGIEGLFKKNGVTHLQGTGKVLSNTEVEVDGEVYKTKNVVLASGSEPTPLPFLPFDEEKVVSSTGALSLKNVPEHLVVIGGGVIGLEMGSVYRRLGAKVSVVEFFDVILPGMEKDVSKTMQKVLKQQGFEFYLGHKVTSADTDGKGVVIHAESKKGEKIQLDADVALVSIGRRAYSEGLGLDTAGIEVERGKVVVDDHFETNVKGVYAIGDLIDGPMLAHKAEEEGVAVMEIIAGGHGHVNYMEIPGIVYTWPEVGSVGLTTEECKEAGLPVKAGKYPFMANPRARCMGEKDGFVKVLAHAETDRVLGVHVIGPSASELIAEAVTVMAFEGCAEDIAHICHGHPTLSEAMKEAAMDVHKRAIHI